MRLREDQLFKNPRLKIRRTDKIWEQPPLRTVSFSRIKRRSNPLHAVKSDKDSDSTLGNSVNLEKSDGERDLTNLNEEEPVKNPFS